MLYANMLEPIGIKLSNMKVALIYPSIALSDVLICKHRL
ncbi:hypothetical protein AO376_1283 [Moraxella catarrhalis]|nr:hypothetical protein AO376_1283 [Moraxella catarrhalis]OAV16763.1 hypothetical protein AO374_1298 [Moraxella catarrhalis]